ncbi:MAG: hypothetical protein HKM02_06805 [Pseudomonadales bacterium]|nr:hypothetical protein [Pseudomonadales bacterium]
MSVHERFWTESALQVELVAYLDDLLAPAKPKSDLSVVQKVSQKVDVVEMNSTHLPDISKPTTLIETNISVQPPPTRTSLAQLTQLACLYIVCEGVRYALPLIQLGRIFRADIKLTPMVGQQAWQLGLLAADQVLQAVNLHYVLTGGQGAAPRYYVSVAGSCRVLGCEAILHSERLTQVAIRWRPPGPKMPMIAGIVRENLVPLLDLSRLEECLH